MTDIVDFIADLKFEDISEEALDETLKSAFPGLKVHDSILDVPIGQFLKLRLESAENKSQSKIKEAISNLVNFAHDTGKITKPENSKRMLDAIYTDQYGIRLDRSFDASPLREHGQNDYGSPFQPRKNENLTEGRISTPPH